MIIESRALSSQAVLSADVCIVGSGAAGITLACELDRSGLSVLLIEAGGIKLDAALTDEVTGSASDPHPEPSAYRRLAFGGTTSIWGGRCVPFDPIDFERREHISNSGWPISYDEVAQYYPRALAYCHAGKFDFTVTGSLGNVPPTIPGLQDAPEMFGDRVERYSLPTNFAKEYGKQLDQSDNVQVILNARCVAINRASGAERVESIEFAGRDNQRRWVKAKEFVLAVGGIETARLLFAADKEGPGLGNHSDQLGRYYACHFENVCAKVIPNGVPIAFDFEKTTDGIYCRRKFQFSADAQRQYRLLNSAFRLHFPDYSDATHGSAVMSTIYLAKSTLIPEYRNILQSNPLLGAPSPASAHIRNMLTGVPQLAKFGYQWLFLRVLAKRKLPYTLVANADGSYPLEFNSEQTPLAHSRVTPIADVDSHGLRRVHVDWHICEDDISAAERAFILFREVMSRSTKCRIEVDDAQLKSRIQRSIPVGGHHIGTARMASTASQGVVDQHCAVFGLANLYIASSAVFPTNSHANPTLTIVAMAIRLAERLKKSTVATQVIGGA